MDKWEKYFIVLGGVNSRVVRGIRGERGGGEKGLEKGEMWEILKGMKDNKMAGIDGISTEVWKYGEEEMVLPSSSSSSSSIFLFASVNSELLLSSSELCDCSCLCVRISSFFSFNVLFS